MVELAQSICVSGATMQKLVQQGKQSLQSKEWRDVVERKAHRGRLWKVFGSGQCLRGMCGYFTLARAWARKIFADAAQEKQERIQGQWQHESPFNEVFGASQQKRDYRFQCLQMMRRAYDAKALGNWESFEEECTKEGKRTGFRRPMARLEDSGRLSIAEEQGLYRTDHRPSRRNQRSYFVVRLPALQLLPTG